jgi:hypothetical protein
MASPEEERAAAALASSSAERWGWPGGSRGAAAAAARVLAAHARTPLLQGGPWSGATPPLPLPLRREARIAARRKRVQEKLAAVRAQGEAAARGGGAPAAAPAGKPEQQPQAATASASAAAGTPGNGGGGQASSLDAAYPRAAAQAADSARRLLRLRHRTTQEVTAVRVATDEAESAHRAAEEQMRQVRSLVGSGWAAAAGPPLRLQAEQSCLAAHATRPNLHPVLPCIPAPARGCGTSCCQRRR